MQRPNPSPEALLVHVVRTPIKLEEFPIPPPLPPRPHRTRRHHLLRHAHIPRLPLLAQPPNARAKTPLLSPPGEAQIVHALPGAPGVDIGLCAGGCGPLGFALVVVAAVEEVEEDG